MDDSHRTAKDSLGNAVLAMRGALADDFDEAIMEHDRHRMHRNKMAVELLRVLDDLTGNTVDGALIRYVEVHRQERRRQKGLPKLPNPS